MAKAIVAIGGGEIRTRGTADIDREIIRLSNKKHPKVLFIPAASSDSERYCRNFTEYFGKFLKCHTDVLLLVDAPPSAQEIERKIFSSHVVYVGGGNTLHMMRVWRRIDGRFYRVIASKDYSRAYRVYQNRGEVVAEQIRKEEQLAPLASLTRP